MQVFSVQLRDCPNVQFAVVQSERYCTAPFLLTAGGDVNIVKLISLRHVLKKVPDHPCVVPLEIPWQITELDLPLRFQMAIWRHKWSLSQLVEPWRCNPTCWELEEYQAPYDMPKLNMYVSRWEAAFIF